MIGFHSYALFLLIVLPLVGAGVILVTPGTKVKTVRLAATTTALLTLLLSAYVFLAYDHSNGGIQFERIWQWLSMPGPWPLGDHAVTLHLGIDGIAAPMVLLTGIVLFTGTVPASSVRRVRRVCHARHVLFLFLLRVGRAANVPAHRSLGQQLEVPDIQPRQGIRRDEVDDLPGRWQRADLDCSARNLRRGRSGHI